MAVIEGQESFPGMPSPLFAASPSRLLAFQDCPRRYRFQYLDRPTPQRRSQRAHTSLGIAVHNALRDWWDMPIAQRNPGGGAALVERAWISVGFRDGSQSARWRERSKNAVAKYLEQVDPAAQPVGIERTVAFVTEGLRVSGRIDRLDDRGGELVVIDYKTSRVVPTADDARTSLALGLYAAAVWKMFRRPALRVELHHVPSGEVASHLHTPEGIARKVAQARGIARDAQRAEADLAALGEESTAFPPSIGPLCTWCDFRAHCPQGQAVGPERSDWAALEEDGPVPASAEVD